MLSWCLVIENVIVCILDNMGIAFISSNILTLQLIPALKAAILNFQLMEASAEDAVLWCPLSSEKATLNM